LAASGAGAGDLELVLEPGGEEEVAATLQLLPRGRLNHFLCAGYEVVNNLKLY